MINKQSKQTNKPINEWTKEWTKWTMYTQPTDQKTNIFSLPVTVETWKAWQSVNSLLILASDLPKPCKVIKLILISINKNNIPLGKQAPSEINWKKCLQTRIFFSTFLGSKVLFWGLHSVHSLHSFRQFCTLIVNITIMILLWHSSLNKYQDKQPNKWRNHNCI